MPPKPPPSKKPQGPPPKPLQFGKPEKTNWLPIILFLIFAISGIGGSIWLLHMSPRMHPLDCDASSGMGTLTSFGGCHDRAD